jgi:hypothetical protein
MSPARRRCVVDAIYVAMHHPRDDIGDRAEHRTTPHSYQRTVVVVEKRTFEVVVTNELRYASAREMKVLFPFFGWPHVADWHPETMIWADAIQPRTKPKQGPKACVAA